MAEGGLPRELLEGPGPDGLEGEGAGRIEARVQVAGQGLAPASHAQGLPGAEGQAEQQQEADEPPGSLRQGHACSRRWARKA